MNRLRYPRWLVVMKAKMSLSQSLAAQIRRWLCRNCTGSFYLACALIGNSISLPKYECYIKVLYSYSVFKQNHSYSHLYPFNSKSPISIGFPNSEIDAVALACKTILSGIDSKTTPSVSSRISLTWSSNGSGFRSFKTTSLFENCTHKKLTLLSRFFVPAVRLSIDELKWIGVKRNGPQSTMLASILWGRQFAGSSFSWYDKQYGRSVKFAGGITKIRKHEVNKIRWELKI